MLPSVGWDKMKTITVEGIEAELHDTVLNGMPGKPDGEISEAIEFQGRMYVFSEIGKSGNPEYYLEK